MNASFKKDSPGNRSLVEPSVVSFPDSVMDPSVVSSSGTPRGSSWVPESPQTLRFTKGVLRIPSFRDRMEEQSQRTLELLRHDSLTQGFLVGTHNSQRLTRALQTGNVPHLINRTLLSRSVHETHTDLLFNRLQKQCGRKRNQDIKFLTVLHKLVGMDASICLQEVLRFKDRLDETFGQCRGIHVIGTMECEVVSLDLMRQVMPVDSSSEKHKLKVLENLHRKSFPRKESGTETDHVTDNPLPIPVSTPSYFLVHFHGVVVEHHWKSTLSDALGKSFGQVPNQVLLQPLSEQFGGKTRTVQENLKFIARYLTKGGNDFINGQSYLRYKIRFKNEVSRSEEEWVSRHWRTDEDLRREHLEEGVNDPLSLSRGEICHLARVIDGMMGWHRRRTGYVYELKTRSRRTRVR